MKAERCTIFSLRYVLAAVHALGVAGGTCSIESMRGKCECDHHSMRWGFLCSGCIDKRYWGYGCELECSSECAHGCDFVGNCLVPSLDNCKHSTRVENPTHNSERLNGFQQCQACESGFYGQQCEFSCGPETGMHCENSGSEGLCTRMGSCYHCEAGWYGHNCTTPCPPGCPNDCVQKPNEVKIPGTSLYMQPGSCPNGCKGDYYGPECDVPCPTACDKSATPSCTVDGKCIACADKWTWGAQCEHRCSEGCRYGCEKDSGICISEKCKSAWWGEPVCDKKCSPYCASGSCFGSDGKCKGDCDWNIGIKCLGICKPGWWLEDCTEPCPNRTVGGCSQLYGWPDKCVKGYYPELHDTQPIGIFSVVSGQEIHVYDQEAGWKQSGWIEDGETIRVTQTGNHTDSKGVQWQWKYYDKLVDESRLHGLIKHAVSPASGTIAKRADTGRVAYPWLLDYHTAKECAKCPVNCIDGDCDKYGHCTKGCIPGSYGPNCDKPCPAHCTGEGCDKKHAGARRDGECKNCMTGYTGTTCKRRCNSRCVSCLQGTTVNGATKANQCTSCPVEYPNVDISKKSGSCDCISSAEWDADSGSCKCVEPDNEPTRQAHFELHPEKSCRFICKKSGPIKYVEVFGHMRSTCITKAKEKIVWGYHFAGKSCEAGCEEKDDCKFECGSLPAEKGGCDEKEAESGFFCLDKEYSDYIKGNWEPEDDEAESRRDPTFKASDEL